MVAPFNLMVITFSPSTAWKKQDFNFTSETSALHYVCFDQADNKAGMQTTTHTHTHDTRAEKYSITPIPENELVVLQARGMRSP